MHDLLDQPLEDKRSATLHRQLERFKWVVIGLFIVGLLFKNRHWPGAGLILVVAAISSLLYIANAAGLWIRTKESKRALFAISFGLSFLYFVFRFQYWPGAAVVLALTGATALAALLIQREKATNLLSLFLVGIALLLARLPNSSVYYYTNMSKTLNPYDHENACMAWNRYADLLDGEGRHAQADKARAKWLECTMRNEF